MLGSLINGLFSTTTFGSQFLMELLCLVAVLGFIGITMEFVRGRK